MNQCDMDTTILGPSVGSAGVIHFMTKSVYTVLYKNTENSRQDCIVAVQGIFFFMSVLILIIVINFQILALFVLIAATTSLPTHMSWALV